MNHYVMTEPGFILTWLDFFQLKTFTPVFIWKIILFHRSEEAKYATSIYIVEVLLSNLLTKLNLE